MHLWFQELLPPVTDSGQGVVASSTSCQERDVLLEGVGPRRAQVRFLSLTLACAAGPLPAPLALLTPQHPEDGGFSACSFPGAIPADRSPPPGAVGESAPSSSAFWVGWLPGVLSTSPRGLGGIDNNPLVHCAALGSFSSLLTRPLASQNFLASLPV